MVVKLLLYHIKLVMGVGVVGQEESIYFDNLSKVTCASPFGPLALISKSNMWFE